jgi:hypothetical protein
MIEIAVSRIINVDTFVLLLERDEDSRAGKEVKSRDRGIEITFESRS